MVVALTHLVYVAMMGLVSLREASVEIKMEI
jgi:hypothetical protein